MIWRSALTLRPGVIRPAYYPCVTDWEKPSLSGWSDPGQTVLLSVSPNMTWRRMADFIYSFSEDPVGEKVILCAKRFYLLLRHDLWAEQGPETSTHNFSLSWGCWCVSFLFSSPWVVSSPRVVDLGSSASSNYKCAVNYVPLCLPRYLYFCFLFQGLTMTLSGWLRNLKLEAEAKTPPSWGCIVRTSVRETVACSRWFPHPHHRVEHV